MSVSNVIVTENLSKIYRTRISKGLLKKEEKIVEALKGVSFEVMNGEIFGLLGPNGAGKTTLIKILTTLLIPDKGRAFVNGFDVLREPKKVKASIGVMLMGERSLYWKLTGRENLEYFAALYKIPSDVARKRINEIVEFLGIQDFIDRLVETYSSGQKMLLAFAKALINDAPLLFLDEPTVAMDPKNAAMIRSKIRQLNKELGKTILLTTHLMHEAETLCNRVAIIDKGRIIAIGTPDELKETLRGKSSIELDVLGNNIDKIVSDIKNVEGVIDVATSFIKFNSKDAVRIRVLCDAPKEILAEIIDKLIDSKVDILYINPQEPTLEDVFMHYTGRLLSEDQREGL